jgi:DNA invertase Pin-like site-specific DNA recombinase
METIKFTSTGLVHGNYWGGGKGAYKAEKLSADTKEELIEKATKMLEDGSLDGGMGYESLIGALLSITKTTSIIHNGKPFTNEETEFEFIGELTEEDQDFLIECEFSM